MTKQELQQLRKAYEASTQGEWRAGRADMISYDMRGTAFKNLYTENQDDTVRFYTEKPVEDSKFTELAHNKIPALLDYIDRLEKALDYSKEQLVSIYDQQIKGTKTECLIKHPGERIEEILKGE